MLNYDEREEALKKMRAASDAFYYAAIHTGVHPFIEFTGLINEYLLTCEVAQKKGIDFSECNAHSGRVLPVAPHSIDYINEKLECIFTGRVMMVENVEGLAK